MSITPEASLNMDQQSQKTSKIHILQHNCNRSTSAMQSCLKYAVNQADIVVLQEPWIGPNNITVSHPAFTCILPASSSNLRPKVVTFVSKKQNGIRCTPRPDVSMDSDLQALSITGTGFQEVLLLNIYNKKSLQVDSTELTVERTLKQITTLKRTIICGDFNAHHTWWNSTIATPKNADAIISWVTTNKLDLVNTPDTTTFTRKTPTGQYSSVLNLTFASSQMMQEIIDWQVNDQAYTGSDHEVIQFAITTPDLKLVPSPFNAPFNTEKAD